MTRMQKLSAALVLATLAGHAAAQVQHGALDLFENDCGNNPTSVTVTPLTGTGDWSIVDAETNRGDYTIDFGTGDDLNLGVLITGSYDDERPDLNLCGGNDPYWATTSHARGGSGFYFIAIHDSPAGNERNWNPSFAYFPFADGWMAGAAYNSENGGIIDELVANPSIPLYNTFDDPGTGNGFIDTATGNFGVRLEGIDLRRDGVLLGCGAKNEDNHVQVFLSYDGTGVLNNHDNGDDAGGNEQDPVAFVYIPDGTPGVTMGVITGTGRTLYSQGDFTCEMVGQPETDGTFRLEIAGESPSTGTLVVSPTTDFAGTNVDNPVFVTPDSGGWTITTRDVTGMGLQDVGSNQLNFIFAFFENDADITPGSPDLSYRDRMGVVHAARYGVTEYLPDNGAGDMRADRVMGSDALGVSGDNRADVGLTFFDARHAAVTDNSLDTHEGVYLTSASEFVRDNSGTGGVSGWTTTSFDNGEMHAHNASLIGGEINSDFAAAFFPVEAGFVMDADIQVLTDPSYTVTVAGDAVNDGVLMALNWDNNNRTVAVEAVGTDYVVTDWEGSGGAQSTDWDFGYVYLPYSTPGLVAGHVDSSGAVVSGTGGFSTSTGNDQTWGFPVTKITIPGVDSRADGILLLTDTRGGYSSAWEAGEDGTFEVAALNLATETPGRSSFMFAYIPYEGLAAGEDCVADWNGDGAVNTIDFLAFLSDWSAQRDDDCSQGGCSADLNGDGTVNTQDFLAFLNLWSAGC